MKRRIKGFAIGLAYIIAAGVLAGLTVQPPESSMAWHIVFSPYIVGALFYPFVGVLLADLNSRATETEIRTTRMILVIVLGLNYLLTALTVFLEWKHFVNTISLAPSTFLALISFYILGHGVIWAVWANRRYPGDKAVIDPLK